MNWLSERAPASYSEMAKLSSIPEQTSQPRWEELARNLALGHDQVAKPARAALRIAEETGDDASADVITPRITLYEKTAWMLRATVS